MFIPFTLLSVFLLMLALAAISTAQEKQEGRQRRHDLKLAILAVRTLITDKCPDNQVALQHLQKAEWYALQADKGKTWASVRSLAVNGIFEAQLARDLANASATGKSDDSEETQPK